MDISMTNKPESVGQTMLSEIFKKYHNETFQVTAEILQ